MAIANLQAQMVNLTSLMLQYIERSTMQSVATFGASYRQGYQTNHHPQLIENGDWDNVNAWGYQGHNQSRNDLFSNTYNPGGRDHSNFMWREPQQVQQEGYWQTNEELYSRLMQPPQPPLQQFQPNSSMSMDHVKILQTLIIACASLTQDLENQAKEMVEFKNQLGQIAEFMGQIREQSELPGSTIVNPNGGFETAKAITLRSGK
ncbi:hypothetical protein ACFX12_030140 [Malus domestica]